MASGMNTDHTEVCIRLSHGLRGVWSLNEKINMSGNLDI